MKETLRREVTTAFIDMANLVVTGISVLFFVIFVPQAFRYGLKDGFVRKGNGNEDIRRLKEGLLLDVKGKGREGTAFLCIVLSNETGRVAGGVL